jgi:tetratricopeptide (TPR) repeat protein
MFAVLLLLLMLVGACRPVDDLRARLDLKNGNLHYLRGEYEAAVGRYERVLAHDPDDAQAHVNMGYGLMALARGSPDSTHRRELAVRAVKTFAWLLEPERDVELGEGRMPTRERIEQYILTLLLDAQLQEEAIEVLTARAKENPDDVASMQMLSNLCVELGSLNDALAWREKCLEVQPDRPEAHYSMGVFAWRLSYENRIGDSTQREAVVERGLQAVERALELRPHYFEALTYQNLLYREKARYAPKEEDRRGFEALAARAEKLALELWEASAAAGQ